MRTFHPLLRRRETLPSAPFCGLSSERAGHTTCWKKVIGLDAILFTIRVSDVDRALRFYRDQLGLPLVHTDRSFHEFDTGGARLAIDAGGVAAPAPKGPDRCPVEIHLRVADIQATRAKLEAQGVPFAGETLSFSYGKFARFFDPDGTPLLLFQPGECPLKAAAQGVSG